MAQLANMMSGLSIDPAASPSPASRTQKPATTTQAQGGNRLPMAMKKYMNPDLVRPPNAALANHHQSASGSSSANAAIRGPLLKLAGINVESPPRNGKFASPKGKGKSSIGVHTAHGIHGPAHSTTNRAMASAINAHPVHPTAGSASGAVRKVEKSDGGIGKYDGGLELDEANSAAVTGESAKLLEMDSGAGGA
jgi:aurora kinase